MLQQLQNSSLWSYGLITACLLWQSYARKSEQLLLLLLLLHLRLELDHLIEFGTSGCARMREHAQRARGIHALLRVLWQMR